MAIVTAIAFFVAGTVFAVGIVAIPIVIVLGIAKAVHWYVTLPVKTPIIAQAVQENLQAAGFPTSEQFFDSFWVRYENECKAARVTPAGYNTLKAILTVAVDLYAAEELNAPKPHMRRIVEGTIADGEFRDDLIERSRHAAHPERTLEVITKTLCNAFLGFTSSLPPAALEDRDRDDSTKAGTTVPLVDMMPDTRQAVQYLIAPFYQKACVELGLFSRMRAQIDANMRKVDKAGDTMPMETKLGPVDAIEQYLYGTGFYALFQPRIPWEIPAALRFEHQWIVTPQGGGKTTFIQHQLIGDIQRVVNDEASVVVMDSQSDLINLVAGLKMVPPEKLLVIEPDPAFPLSLNLFDLGKSRAAEYDERTRQMLDTNAIELLTYVFDTLLGTATTPKQSALFRHSIRLCRAIPNATIATLQEILQARGVPFPEYVKRMPDATREFFETLFVDAKQFASTRQEVGWRLSLMLENDTFAGMFSQKESKLDLFQELNSSKLILINTDKGLLKQNGTELFGRFFIALILQAAQERAMIARANRLPTYVYIDEAHDYISHDTNVTTIFDQARKMNIGLTIAHQRIAQMDGPVLDALTNASIKCARAVSDSGAHVLARNMGTTPDFIQKQPVGSFAISLRNELATSIKIPAGAMEALPRRSATELKQIRQYMRERYAVPYRASVRQVTADEEVAAAAAIPTSDEKDETPTQWPVIR